jgi:chitodextrinase
MKKIAFLLCIVLILVSCAPENPKTISNPVSPEPTLTTEAQVQVTGEIPNFDHIVLILLENRDYTNLIGNPKMPHLNSLAQQYVLLSNYFAVQHPSLPNYIALMSGGTQSVTKDCTDCFINQPNLADVLEANGRTWKSYLEDMPSPCFIGDQSPYMQKHNPLIYFDSVRLNADRCKRGIVPLTDLDTDLATNRLPNFSFIMPNMCNSGYECEPQVTDTWVSNMVAKLQAAPAFGQNSLIIITFDEGNEHNNGTCCGLGPKAGGQVPAILISPLAQSSFNDTTAYSHYSVLKLILDAWKLPDLGLSASAPRVVAPWQEGAKVSTQSTSQAPAALPQPTVVTNCLPSSPPAGNYTITACYVNITDGATLRGDAIINATVSTTEHAPGIQRIIFYLDGAYLLTDYESPYSFTLPTTKWSDGRHTLSMEAMLRDNFTSQQANLSLNFNNGPVIPETGSQFTPSTGIPPANGAPFIVVAGGDGAGGETNATSVSNLIASLNPNLFLYLGDVYEKGSPTEFYNWYGRDGNNFARFRSITDPTVGNHEYLTEGAKGYFEYWNNIPSYYSFNAGGWHFISLNSSNPSGEPFGSSSAQYQWLQKDLAANQGACTIAYYHHPLFNIGDEGSTPQLKDIWNLMAQNGVEIVLNGHDHDYQRWVPLDGNGQPSPNGITEFIAGASGHGLQGFLSTDKRVAFSSDSNPATFGVLFFQLNPHGANFSYRTAEGEILDAGVVPCIPNVPDTQPPAKPGNLSVTANGPTRVDLTWSASSDDTGVSGYTIYRNGTPIGTAPASSQTYSDTTAVADTTYNYAIDALDPANNHSEMVEAAPVSTQSMPSSLSFPVEADTYVSASSPQSNYGAATAWWVDSGPDMHAYLALPLKAWAKLPSNMRGFWFMQIAALIKALALARSQITVGTNQLWI